MSIKNTQEEISIRELMGLFIKLWDKIVKLFLQAVLFVIKHAIPLVLLIAIGVGVAYFYKEANPRYKRSFIVSTTEYSGEFLTQELNEINRKFATNSEELKQAMHLQNINLNGVHYTIKPIYDKGAVMNREEYQYLNYIIENKLVLKENLERMVELSNYSYEIEMIYPRDLDGLHIFNTTLDYLRANEYASELHQAILTDIEFQIEENNSLVSSLGRYVASLSADEKQERNSEIHTIVVEGTKGADLGEMMFARMKLQEINNKLISRKVQLKDNFRVLNHGNAIRFYGVGIMSKKTLVYPFLLVSAYLGVIFVIYILRAALALKAELKREEE